MNYILQEPQVLANMHADQVVGSSCWKAELLCQQNSKGAPLPRHKKKKKKRQKDTNEAMAKPSSGFPYLPKIHMDSKIHTAVTG